MSAERAPDALSVAAFDACLPQTQCGRCGYAGCLPYAEALIKLYQLQSRPLIEPVVRRKFFVFTRRDRPFSPAARRFASYLFEHVAKRQFAGQVRA